MKTISQIDSEIESVQRKLKALRQLKASLKHAENAPNREKQQNLKKQADADRFAMLRLFCAGARAKDAAKQVGRPSWGLGEICRSWKENFRQHWLEHVERLDTEDPYDLRKNPPDFGQ